ncbi:MAG: pyruvate, phosphate dikinase [Desulfobacterales bacterium]|nr:pyruvate, phosphate dikinase [Desulfobacterales bacterium]
MRSKALEINLSDYHVDVVIDPKYTVLQEIMSKYYGLMEGVNTFLKELSHPYRNWQFIVKEARSYSLDYFHLLKNHPKGHEAAYLFIEIFTHAIDSAADMEVKADAADNIIIFLQKIINEAGPDLENFLPILDQSFDRIRNYEERYFFLFVKSFYPIKRLAEVLLNNSVAYKKGFEAINLLLLRYFRDTYNYWLSEEDPQKWFEKEAGNKFGKKYLNGIFYDISHAHILELNHLLDSLTQTKQIDATELLKSMIELPGYHQLVEIYREIPQKLFDLGVKKNLSNQWKLLFLFHIMNISGLNSIHEETLREINRTLIWIIGHETHQNIKNLIQKTFTILKPRTSKFPNTALNCIQNMGKGLYQTNESDLVNFFIDYVIDLGFQAPMIKGVGNDWQIQANPAHIQNIRTWIELIELNPKWSTRLLSYLIIHLSLCGVFIKDTDLFPRDITRFLNSNIEPVYNLAKQLSKLFPAYFNDIGAEGLLRDISTKIDEITHRKDILIHFLRKQSHVESSNRIISFMEATLRFWKTKEKSILRPFVPPTTYDQIDNKGPYIDGVHNVLLHLEKKGLSLPNDLLTIKEEKLSSLLEDLTGVPEIDLERIKLAVAFYKLLNQKYNLDFTEMSYNITQLKSEAFPDLDLLKKALAETGLKRKLFMLLEYLERLKNLILSNQIYEIREDIYKKRHFTVDIPSMYGTYHEMKFDALGLTFRIESLVNVLFEELVENIDLSLITKATFYQIYDLLILFDKALKLDGIPSVEIERQLEMLAHSLEVRGFTFTQYLDIFKNITQAVKNIINDYFNNIHEQNLTGILSKLPVEDILPKYLPKEGMVDDEKLKHIISEIFFREKIALSLGLQQLDLFLSRILNTLFHQSDKLPKEKLHMLLNYDPQKAMMSIDQANSWVSGIIYLGNKGFNLVKLKNFGYPVPPGFIITTEVYRCGAVIDDYSPAAQNFKEQVAQHISALEKITGKYFGDPKNPLLFSVRSGSSISQPGMLATFLDVGINEKITIGIAAKTGNTWFAWDNYRRFLQGYGMVFNLQRDDFDAIISEFKQRLGIPYKKDFSGDQMRQVAMKYKEMINDSGIYIIEDPFEQLQMAIKRVFRSWESPKAKTYRNILGISDDWGTAVTVQSMVFGNISQSSGSGVFFTHNPRWSDDHLRLWGDFTLGNQGEDVVSGLVKTLPISIMQQESEMRKTDITLETHFPEIYTALENWANELIYKRGWSAQEMEFTFESPFAGDLYLLQTRDMAIRKQKKVLRFDPDSMKEENFLGHGIGVSGGAMSGRVIFSLDEIDKFRACEPKTSLILVRNDTVPDDIKEIYAADGLLTARGGLTSHAAVVAHRLNKTCVVGCGDLVCNEKEKTCMFNQIFLKSGAYISIDGQAGSVYQGLLTVKEA